MVGIFLNYRREDSFGYAGRVYDRLCQDFDHSQIFMDVDTLKPGAAYVEDITTAIDPCIAMITLIGPKWLLVTDKNNKRRIENPEDLVRQEISAALKRNILVIPLLLPAASMPAADELPNEIQTLVLRNAISLSDVNFHREMENIVRSIKNEPKRNIATKVRFYQIPILKGIVFSTLLGCFLTILIALSSELLLGWTFALAELFFIFGVCITLLIVAIGLWKLALTK